MLRKETVCQTQVKHRANIVSHNSAHLQRRWKHVRDSWDTWLPEWFVDSFVFCSWVVLCFFLFTCVLFMMSFRCVYDSLCLLLCCVYVVLCWFFTSLVYVRLLASDLVPIDEALWVYLRHIASLGMSTANFCTAQRILASFSPLNDGKSKQRDHVDKETNKKTNMKILFLALKASQSWQ